MSRAVLADKLEDGHARQGAVATWNTRRVPTRLTPGVGEPALRGVRRTLARVLPAVRGHRPDSGGREGVLRLYLRPRRWTPIAPAPSPRFPWVALLERHARWGGADLGTLRLNARAGPYDFPLPGVFPPPAATPSRSPGRRGSIPGPWRATHEHVWVARSGLASISRRRAHPSLTNAALARVRDVMFHVRVLTQKARGDQVTARSFART
jgi:hypothetical protein